MRQLLSLLVFVVIFSSCSEYQKVLKNEDSSAKYELAEKLYNAKDYKKANRLLEQIAPKYVGKPQGERVMFFFADSYFKIGDYNLAGYQFERFIKSYPKSEKLQEAAFLGAQSYYELSPKYSLDQTDTDKALVKLQNFINTYPNSEFFERANIMAKELTTKKEKKAIEIVAQYNKISAFDFSFLTPAISGAENFLSDFPGSIYREDALFYKFNASTNFAINSFDSKKAERLQSAKVAYNNLKKYYPESKYLKKADDMMQTINKELENFSK